MWTGCLPLPVSQSLCSAGSPEPEFLSQPDLKGLGLLRQKDSLSAKPRQNWSEIRQTATRANLPEGKGAKEPALRPTAYGF